MIEVIPGFPPNVAAFNATGKITGQDYDEIIINTPLENYNLEAWLKDAILGFVYFTEWKKIGIVSEKRSIRNFTNLFGILIPGCSKGFLMEELDAAKEWIVK
jgi:hypothetical protein